MAAKMQHTHLMKRILMLCLFALVGLLLAGTIATFLRHVTLLSGLMAFLVFFGMVLTFLLGAFLGFDYAQLSNHSPDTMLSSANTISLIGADTRKPQRQPEILVSRR